MLMERPPCGLARGSFRLSLGLVLIPFEPHTACSAGERVHDKKPEAAAGQAQGADGRRRLRRGGVQSANPGKWDHGHGARCLSSARAVFTHAHKISASTCMYHRRPSALGRCGRPRRTSTLLPTRHQDQCQSANRHARTERSGREGPESPALKHAVSLGLSWQA
jgi:hypothetical protein